MLEVVTVESIDDGGVAIENTTDEDEVVNKVFVGSYGAGEEGFAKRSATILPG